MLWPVVAQKTDGSKILAKQHESKNTSVNKNILPGDLGQKGIVATFSLTSSVRTVLRNIIVSSM